MTNLISEKLSLSKLQTVEIVKNVTLTFLFALITAFCAKIEIPVQPVPFTLQTLAVISAGIFLGARAGAYSQIMYILLGVSGIPVFAHTADFSAGIATLISPTGGYLLAFPVAAFVSGSLTKHNKGVFSTIIAFLSGEAIILTSGMLLLNFLYIHNLGKSFILGVAPFLVWTVAKTILGAGISKSYLNLRSKFSK